MPSRHMLLPPGTDQMLAPDLERLARVSVVGSTCSGKTTLSEKLAAILEVPHIELDAVQWMENWEPRDPESFREIALPQIAEERWVVDGNYSIVRGEVWQRATAVVWLNYPFLRNLHQLIYRTLRLVTTGEELWSGNRETWQLAFLSRDSLFIWLWKTHGRNRRRYKRAQGEAKNRHLTFFEFTHPRQADRFLRSVEHSRVTA